jgi:probable HAF family extracellular repeat protein
MQVTKLVVILLGVITALPPVHAGAYEFTAFGPNSWGLGASSDGSVVIGAYGVGASQQAFRWTPSSGMVGLGYLPGTTGSSAWGVSADGNVVVGNSGYQTFRWTSSGGMVALPSSPGYNQANGVSDDGSVVVGWSGTSLDNQATRWTQSGIERLGYMGGYTAYSYLYGASADGSVVVGDSAGHAFRWTQTTGMVSLGNLPGQSSSYARDVSADGSIIVGSSGSSTYQAYRWTQTGGMIGLGYLPGASDSYAYGMSADGSIIVGESGGQAFIWDSTNGMRSLQYVLTNIYGMNLTGWTLSNAWDISADGKMIVGYGLDSLGQKEGFAANFNPVPIPGAVWLLGSGLIGLIGLRRMKRTQAVNFKVGAVLACLLSITTQVQAYSFEGLGYLPGYSFSSGAIVSGDGSAVVGSSYAMDGSMQAFRWTAGTGMIGVARPTSVATGVTYDGSVVVGGVDRGCPNRQFMITLS